MTQTLPTFDDHNLTYFCFCLWAPVGNSRLSQFVAALKKREVRETRFPYSGGFAWIQVQVDLPKERDGIREARFHADCQPEWRFNPPRSESSKVPNSEAEVRELLELVDDEQVGNICYEGVFQIPFASLPARSIINLMRGFPAEAGGASLAIRAMTLSVHDKPPYLELRWKLGEDGDNDKVTVAISAYGEIGTVRGDLRKMTETLSRGVRELVLQNSPNVEDQP
jgi:hypothetical protein